jgi:alpha-L-rhamnosidase
LDFVPEKAEISICGLGFYCLFINGREITKGYLAPYISNPDDYCYYDKYDITELLQKGKNTIGIILGNGLINSIGGYIWDFDKAAFRDAPKVALELIAECDGYEKICVEADESFKVCPSPITFDDFRYGEYYDARKEIENWNALEFDNSAWESAIPAKSPRGEFRLCEAEPIRVIDVRKPKRIIKCEEGYIYDFGVNSAGICEVNIKNTINGQQLTLRYAEQVKENELFVDSVVFPITRFPDYYENNQKDIYVCRGGESETWKPRFTYHGFRYVLVEGITEEQATEELLTYEVMSSDLARHGNFKCSDETVNKLFEMTKNSDRSNFYYYPTDCPHREKNGWTGDVATSCFHMMMLYDCKQSFKEWLANVRKSQNDVGALPGIVPTAGWGYDWGNGPAWDRAAFYLPYECWRLRGDTQIIKDNAHMMMRYLDYIMTRRNEDGTVSFGLGDWASVGRRYSQFETPLVVSDSILVMDMAKKAAEMFEAIGQTHSANYARGIYLDMRNTIRTELLDKGNCILAGRTQTAQAMGLYHGIFDPDEEQKAFSVLLDLIHEKNDSFDCGILGCMKIFHVLSRFGEGKLAFKMITKKEFPSYGHLIEIGMTSLPERFMPDGAPCDSHNHHFFGDIARWFIREIAGLRVENYKTVVIKPDFTLPITSAQAYYELPSGKVSVKWETENDGKIRLEYVCPEGVDVSMILPEGAICCIERRTA